MRFNNKAYFGYDIQNKLQIIQKTVMCYCQKLYKKLQSLQKKQKTNITESNIYFYKIPGNTLS